MTKHATYAHEITIIFNANADERKKVHKPPTSPNRLTILSISSDNTQLKTSLSIYLES